MPKAEEEAKLFILKEGGKNILHGIASQSKANEYERLDKYYSFKTFTPNIDFDNMKSLVILSAKAYQKSNAAAVIKAGETKGNPMIIYMNRTGNLLRAILAMFWTTNTVELMKHYS